MQHPSHVCSPQADFLLEVERQEGRCRLVLPVASIKLWCINLPAINFHRHQIAGFRWGNSLGYNLKVECLFSLDFLRQNMFWWHLLKENQPVEHKTWLSGISAISVWPQWRLMFFTWHRHRALVSRGRPSQSAPQKKIFQFLAKYSICPHLKQPV